MTIKQGAQLSGAGIALYASRRALHQVKSMQDTTIRNMAIAIALVLFSSHGFASEPLTGVDRAKQLGGQFAIGKEACNVPAEQLAAFKQLADEELHGDAALIAAYNQSVKDFSATIRNDAHWQASTNKNMTCVPTRLLFAQIMMKWKSRADGGGK